MKKYNSLDLEGSASLPLGDFLLQKSSRKMEDCIQYNTHILLDPFDNLNTYSSITTNQNKIIAITSDNIYSGRTNFVYGSTIMNGSFSK